MINSRIHNFRETVAVLKDVWLGGGHIQLAAAPQVIAVMLSYPAPPRHFVLCACMRVGRAAYLPCLGTKPASFRWRFVWVEEEDGARQAGHF